MIDLAGISTFRKRTNVKFTLTTLLIIGLIVIVIMAFSREPEFKIIAGISQRVIKVGEPIHYTDSSRGASKWTWTFPDGESHEPSGYYFFQKPGFYSIRLTINDKYTNSYYVTVLDTPHEVLQIPDSALGIIAPKRALTGEFIEFQVIGTQGLPVTWVFGANETTETNTSATTIHVYDEPGVQIVLVSLPNGQWAKHLITIEAPPSLADSIVIRTQREIDFRKRLQRIANESGDFADNYYSLLNDFLCGNNETIVQVNGEKTNSFYRYCNELYIDNGIQIQSVNLTWDDNCITSIQVKQVKTPWSTSSPSATL